MTTAERITARLKDRKMSRYQLSKRSGVDLAAVYAICSGKRDPRSSTVAKLDAVLDADA